MNGWLGRYELGEAYRDMMEIKISQVESGEKKIKWEKIADLCDGATRHFRAFGENILPSTALSCPSLPPT
jgi:hypothetical protein